MKFFNDLFNNMGIRKKLLIYFTFLILLPITTLGMMGNIIYTRTIESETNTNTIQMIEEVKKNTEFYIKDMENIIYYISKEPPIVELLQENLDFSNATTQLKSKAKVILKNYTDIHPEIAGIIVVNKNGTYVSNEMSKISRDSLIYESWYNKAACSSNTVQLISKPIGRNLSTNYSADNVLSVVKAIEDSKGNCMGIIMIDFKLDTIRNVIKGIKLGKNGFIYIIDSNGEIVYTPVNPIVYRIKNEWLNSPTQSAVRSIDGNKYKIIYRNSNYTKWRVVGVFSLNEILSEVIYIRNFTFIIGGLTLLLAMLIALFFTNSIERPINKLRRLMKIAEDGDFSIKFNSKYKDEIGQLGNSFNNMIVKIKNLIDMVYEEQKSKREAELETLQAQIKPHFLYNTLDTIQWMARDYNADDIVEIVCALTKLFRISLSKGKEVINVSEELEHVRNYLVIQKVRYEDKLNYEINYDEKILKYKVIKLILQPLVENAIYHGIKEKRGSGKILINATIKDNKLYFGINDDGIGIKPEKLKELNDMLKSNDSPGNISGYGLFNVNERIKLSFGNKYGLNIYSVYGKGTTVEVWNPIIER